MSKNGENPLYGILGLLLFPFIILFWPLKILHDLVLGLINSPSLEERKARKLTHQLYEQATAGAPVQDPDIPYLNEVFGEDYEAIPDVLLEQMAWIAQKYGRPASSIPPPPAVCNSIEGARYRDFLARQSAPPRNAAHIFALAFNELRFALPCCDDTGLTVSLRTAVPNLNQLVQNVILAFYQEGGEEFVELRKQFDRNLYEASGGGKREIFPEDYKGDDVITTYLKNTPFIDLFSVYVPFTIPFDTEARYEGQWIVAPQGSGKSQFIQFQFAQLIPEVLAGRASIIVMDSQEKMIERMAHLTAVKDHLVLIDAKDVEYPLAFNLFDLGTTGDLSPLEQERQFNTALSIIGLILDSLLGSDLTSKQEVVFRFLTAAMLAIPDATILTFQDLLQNGTHKYQRHINTLDETARSFFETQFNDKQFAPTRTEINRRLYGILAIPAWRRMFTQPRTKLDLFNEMNKGKIILINTAQSLLQPKGCEVFGRFFLALITMSAQRRSTLDHKMPCHVFIDELPDYASDANILTLIEQCRKQKIALTVAHQSTGQLSQRMIDTLQTVGIKCVSSLTNRDAHILASGMHCAPDFLTKQTRGQFAIYARNITKNALSVNVPFGVLEEMETMTDEEFEKIKQDMREKYATQQPPPEEAVVAIHLATITATPKGHSDRSSSVPEPDVIIMPAPNGKTRRRKVTKTAEIKVEEERVDHVDTKPSSEW